MRKSTVLIIVGAVALIFGAVVAGFGVPVQEFSFGNTLILAGATIATGGLIVIALGVVSGQVQHLSEALTHVPMIAGAHESFAAMPAEASPEPHPFEPRGPSAPPEFPMPSQPAPMLRNPEGQVEVSEDVSLSPQPAGPGAKEDRDMPAWMRPRPASESTEERRRSSIFDSMWPPENKMLDGAEKDEKEAAPEPAPPPEPAAGAMAPEPDRAEPAPAAEKPKPRAVAILKSGVVDGMSYTLYVDGSIEAELPQGTLHFASIHELRAHLEQNG